jgi:hypothetical protein
MNTERVRYFPGPDSNRKNTLVTIRDGERIYFGIARCNLDAGDNMKKSHGRMIAKARALRAKVECGSSSTEDFSLHESGLRGVCAMESVKQLLQYFENIDLIMYNESVEGQNSEQETN